MLAKDTLEGDTLVVTKLDRFAPTAIDVASAVRELFDRGVRVHILNMGLVDNTLTGKVVAKQDPNFREGRPKKYTATQMQHAMELLDCGRSYKQVGAMTGISKSTLIRTKTDK